MGKRGTYVAYDSNNSGGRWWLTDDDWKALEAADWKVEWAWLENVYTDEGNYVYAADGTPELVPVGSGNSKYSIGKAKAEGERWLGALAMKAFKVGANSIRDAADEWERVTGKSATDAGCACCGQPHTFTLYRDGEFVASGPDTSYSASW